MRYLSSYSLIKESVAEAKSIWSKTFPFYPENPFLDWFKETFKKNPGYIGQFMKLWVRQIKIAVDHNSASDATMSDHWDEGKTKFDEWGASRSIKNCYNLILKHKQLFKNLDFNNFNSLEQLEDYLNNTIIKIENTNFVKQFISSKYLHLINDDTIALFTKIKDDLKITDPQKIKDLFFKKIAAYNTSEEFNNSIREIIKSLEGSEKDKLVTKIREVTNNKPYFESDNLVIARVNTYEQIQQLGSKNWCIVRGEDYWNDYVCSYTKTPVRAQYIVWDLTKDMTDPLRMIGVTIDSDTNSDSDIYSDNIYAAHDFVDNILNTNSKKFILSLNLKPMSLEEYVKNPDNENNWSALTNFPFDLIVYEELIDVKHWVTPNPDEESDVSFLEGHFKKDENKEILELCLETIENRSEQDLIPVYFYHYIKLHNPQSTEFCQMLLNRYPNIDLTDFDLGYFKKININTDNGMDLFETIVNNPTFSVDSHRLFDVMVAGGFGDITFPLTCCYIYEPFKIAVKELNIVQLCEIIKTRLRYATNIDEEKTIEAFDNFINFTNFDIIYQDNIIFEYFIKEGAYRVIGYLLRFDKVKEYILNNTETNAQFYFDLSAREVKEGTISMHSTKHKMHVNVCKVLLKEFPDQISLDSLSEAKREMIWN